LISLNRIRIAASAARSFVFRPVSAARWFRPDALAERVDTKVLQVLFDLNPETVSTPISWTAPPASHRPAG
jgi:hypothetical protein